MRRVNTFTPENLADLPTGPGIYYHYAADQTLLYIGKAANLKRRVSSYWQKKHGLYPREFVKNIATIQIQETDSVLEALILEANEIHLHQPPGNRDLKDDKTFVTIAITKERFPAILIIRPTQKLKVALKRQFGPYLSADQARTALQIIRRIFPFRTNCKMSSPDQQIDRSSEKTKQPLRGCFDYQIGLCPGPCAGQIEARTYANTIANITLFLEGKKRQVATRLEKEMQAAAKQNKYEQAAQLRNQLFALNHIRDVALLKKDQPSPSANPESWSRIEGYDISNLGQDYAVASMVVITAGQVEKTSYRKFQIKTVTGQNDLKMMEEVLTRRFRHLEWPMPDLVVLDGGKEHLKVGQRVLRQAKLSIPIIAAAKGPNRDRLDLYPSNLRLPVNSEPLRALVRLARDEAHRFAIRYHRVRRISGFLTN